MVAMALSLFRPESYKRSTRSVLRLTKVLARIGKMPRLFLLSKNGVAGSERRASGWIVGKPEVIRKNGQVLALLLGCP